MTETLADDTAEARTHEEAVPLRSWVRIDWTRWDHVALGAVTFVAALLRLVRLDIPKQIIFDETYYAKDACFYVFSSESICEISEEQSNVHPPLGKWLIAIGIRLFGYDSFGWRLAPAVAGVVTVALLYLLARKVLRSTLGATIASGLMAFDFLHFVQSRTSMLDIFVPMFGIAAVLFVVYDHDRYARFGRDGPQPHGLLDRPWRMAAGACAGAAVTSKWSGGFFILLALLLTIVWEGSERRHDERGRWVGRLVREETVTIVLWLVVLPVVIYFVTYAGRLGGDVLTWPPLADGTWWNGFRDRQAYMFSFHQGLESSHSYESPAWTWILLKRPVSYFYERGANGNPAEIFAAGNPFVWWSSILAMLYVAFRWVVSVRRERAPAAPRRVARAEGIILAGFLVTFGPWLLPLSERSAVFIFYLLPTLPFMLLAIGYIATEIGRSWEAKAAVALFTAGTIGLFAFYYPLLAATHIPQEDWDRRIWIFDNCDKPEGTPTTSTITEVNGGKTTLRATRTTSNESLPPTGWCWI